MPTANEMRAEHYGKVAKLGQVEETPNGEARSALHFGAEFRADNIIWNNSERRKLEGYASVVGRKYQMYDMFGEYEELIMPGAFDETLAASPDVAYLVNHRGVTMARTTNGSLELRADQKGLFSVGYLNPKRQDVQDLLVAIEDKDITEMSFAFMIDDGEWNEEYTEYQINKVDINRGDVSAVNFGANPYTSVKARQRDIIDDFRKIPRGAQLAACRAANLSIVDGPLEGLIEKYGIKLDGTTERDAEEQVDKTITDPDTLIVEQWLAQRLLARKR